MIQIEKNTQEIIRRLIKYVLHTALIAILLSYGPCNKLSNQEVITLTLCASSVFVLLDIYSPGVVVIDNKK
tara:strand:- start:1990 stop:2202 length:213 start_codon:yes stop_codon:yes gene_type:complete